MKNIRSHLHCKKKTERIQNDYVPFLLSRFKAAYCPLLTVTRLRFFIHCDDIAIH
jgi:hypothetical protein